MRYKLKISKDHQNFLEFMDIKIERIKNLDLNPKILVDIANDYEQSQDDLFDAAEHIAKKVQRCKQVHSVRWRVKDTSHLIEKILRKKEGQSEKYADIDVTNYKSKIDDLIGVRAIYLFKHDWLPVHEHILSKWTPSEPVTIYYRQGDDLEQYRGKANCHTKEHNDSYRSVHYIVQAGEIHSEKISCEVQTRTIFEEAWSEIDHKVRYPSFSDDPHLKQFLNIFNRLAGSADEMGSYVIALTGLIKSLSIAEEIQLQHQEKISVLERKVKQLIDQSTSLEEIKAAYSELEKAKLSQEHIYNLRTQFNDVPNLSIPLQELAKIAKQHDKQSAFAVACNFEKILCANDLLQSEILEKIYRKD